MLKHVIVMKTSGIIFFKQDFLHHLPNSNLIGQLVGALLDACAQALNFVTPIYVEFRNVAISICLKDRNLAVLIFHDASDGPEFGRILAAEMMRVFVELFPTHTLDQKDAIQREFGANFPLIMQRVIHAVLHGLVQHRGIQSAFLIHTGASSGENIYFGNTPDTLRLEANLRTLLNASAHIMAFSDRNEAALECVLEAARTRTHIIRLTPRATLVVSVARAVAAALAKRRISQGVFLLQNALMLMSRQ
ncbi:hypothetical protein PAPYR_4770 [Paratrimastix pyriformis]|uniref:Uncharacterized protein n=1 Tax=Paratrimastix pyriformis TaxID=342808 RepID=A0ABQ8UJ43_9EUKA|nr:hypothetical protein PAPYR_4770 [Paratrimastix pyriformis]|eukprot:GAFH01002698.1.p1 GENE.GAFH01002698.1~~GAFH01002698.1.p1  ORF type:complete len:248 (+),score=23.34 GAFH01002698.1:43-786(+)